MNDITRKTTGMLIDELYTTDLKIDAGIGDAQERRHTLANMITARTVVLLHDMEKYREFQRTMLKLKAVLKECWDAQEIVMSVPLEDEWGQIGDNIHEVAYAAKVAQRTNAERNAYIRKLDELVGEADITALEKTYA
jgi:hypothetical protein